MYLMRMAVQALLQLVLRLVKTSLMAAWRSELAGMESVSSQAIRIK